jgi:hypothetical protein
MKVSVENNITKINVTSGTKLVKNNDVTKLNFSEQITKLNTDLNPVKIKAIKSLTINNTGATGQNLTANFIAAENISALKAVYLSSDGLRLAEPDSELRSTVLGISKTGGSIGASIEVVLSGQLVDAFFTFSESEPIFLTANGNLSNLPTGQRVTQIGHGLGNGIIIVNIQTNIEVI